MLQSLFNKMIARQNDCFVVLVRASALAKMIVRQNDWRVRLITVLDCLAHKWMGVAWTHVYGERLCYVCQRNLMVNLYIIKCMESITCASCIASSQLSIPATHRVCGFSLKSYRAIILRKLFVYYSQVSSESANKTRCWALGSAVAVFSLFRSFDAQNSNA